MKKTEFPTFLNEQPTVVFGRTMRELMVILIGLALSYAAWTNLSALIPGSNIGITLFKGLVVLIILSATIVVALVNIASRPLEEWALVGFFYLCTPKIFLYMPFDDDEKSDALEIGLLQSREYTADADIDDFS
jgi:hypothetical protein